MLVNYRQHWACGPAGPINLLSAPFYSSCRPPRAAPSSPPPHPPSVASAACPTLLLLLLRCLHHCSCSCSMCTCLAALTHASCACLTTPTTALPPVPTAPALLPARPDDADKRHQCKEKRQALARKPSGLAYSYGCGAAMQTMEAAPRYDACCKLMF
jgi:hypothetical protein